MTTPSKRFYFASKVRHAQRWRDLNGRGFTITSTWIYEAGEGQTADYAKLAVRCLEEIRDSDAVLLYCEPGEVLNGALIECGAALALGIPVRCIGDCKSISRVFRSHPLWSEHPSLAAATVLYV